MVEIIEIASKESLQPASYTTGAYFVVNFGFEDAIRIVPYYSHFSKDRMELLSDYFKDAGINLRPDDILSMLHLVLADLAFLQPDVNTYFVGSAGFTEDSLDFLKRNILKINAFDDKKIYLCCFTLPSNKSYFGTLK